jgi:hypothetical protein
MCTNKIKQAFQATTSKRNPIAFSGNGNPRHSNGCLGDTSYRLCYGMAILFSLIGSSLFAQTATLTPANIAATRIPGQILAEHKVLHMPADVSPPKADILFIMDLTGSMSGELANVRTNSINIMNQISTLIPDSRFGVLSHMDYNGSFTSTSPCAYSAGYGGGIDYPYQRNRALTTDINAVSTSLNTLTIGGGGDSPEDYTRVLYETYADALIGWQPGAKRIILFWQDDIPHDCNYNLDCGLAPRISGPDPGRDARVGTADDLSLQDVLASVAQNNIALIALHSGAYLSQWDCYAKKTGGNAFKINEDGSIPGGIDIATYIKGLIQKQVKHLDTLRLAVTTPGFETWLTSSTPPYYTDITLDVAKDFQFDITLQSPVSTSPGLYNFNVTAKGDGTEYVSQQVALTLTSANHPPIANAGPDRTLSVGSACNGVVTLDGSGSTDPDGDALTYAWTGPFSGTVSGVSPSVTLPTGTHTIILEVTDSKSAAGLDTAQITMADSTAPIPNVPALPTMQGSCSVTISPPSATDNCAAAITGTTGDPLTYNAQGTFTAHWTYTDASGNTSTQNQSVIVKDLTAPKITPKPDTTVVISALKNSSFVNLTPATAFDSCSTAILQPVRDDGLLLDSAYTAGTTNVTWKACDNLGNCDSSIQKVMVIKNRMPQLWTISDTTLYEKDLLRLSITASDSDGNPVLISGAGGLPAGCAIVDSGNGKALLSWDTDYNNQGVYTVRIKAFDGIDSAFSPITITVIPFSTSVTTSVSAISENGGTGNFIISRSDSTDKCIVYFTLSGTAINGTDFIHIPDSLILRNNQQSAAVTIIAIRDYIVEGDELVALSIDSSRIKGRLLTPAAPATASIIITEYLTPVSVGASVSAISENGGSGNFIVNRDDATGPCTVYYTVSGAAVNGTDFAALADSMVLQNGQVSANITITALRDYAVEGDEAVVLTIEGSRSGRTLHYVPGSPVRATISITDYRASVSVNAPTAAMSENGATGQCAFSRTDPIGECIVYYTISGTAAHGADYLNVPDSMVLHNGQLSADVTITALRDYIVEGDETVILTIDSSRTGRDLHYVPGTPARATISITDYVVSASVSVPDSIISEKNGATSFIIRHSDSTEACTVYFTLSGTAVGGTDYLGVHDSVILLAGQRSTAIPITAIRDYAPSGDKTVILTINGARSGRDLHYVPGTPASATISITDYNTSVEVFARKSAISENGTPGGFIIRRSDTLGQCVVYFTLEGTTTPGKDFDAIADSVVLQSGQDSALVTINPLWDYIREPPETVILTIEANRNECAVKYVVGTSNSATLKIMDYTVVASVTASAASMSEKNGTAIFTIHRSDSIGECTVYFTFRGTAAIGEDFTADRIDSVVLKNGQSGVDITINTLRDTIIEKDETVQIVIENSKADRIIKYAVAPSGDATLRIINYVDPFVLVPGAVNNPFQIGYAPVPDFILNLPGMKTNQLTTANGKVQGLVMMIEASPRVKDNITLTGSVSIYDVVLNPVVKEQEMVFEPQTKRLYFVWNGRNSYGNEVALGTYLAVYEVTDNFNRKSIQKIRIGVKR